jgi:capsular exopolysaccharide synthesis family protein
MRSGHIDKTPITLATPGSPAAERYQGLRLRLERLQQTRNVRVIAVTSPGVNDGKTVTSINLAGALALGSGARVLLIDADLRRPSVASHLGLGDVNGPGFAEALGDERIALSQIVRPVDHVNTLSVIPAGSTSTSVHVLFRSPRFEKLLHEARERYDFVVLDTPPLVPVIDAAVLSRSVDGMLIVVAADETPRKLLEAALNMVDEAKVLGIVFNGDSSRLGQYYSYEGDSAGHRGSHSVGHGHTASSSSSLNLSV